MQTKQIKRARHKEAHFGIMYAQANELDDFRVRVSRRCLRYILLRNVDAEDERTTQRNNVGKSKAGYGRNYRVSTYEMARTIHHCG